jgi:hypothetical protein
MVALVPLLVVALSLSFVPAGVGAQPAEYMIITSEALAPEFQRLADWKIEKGIPAEIRTVEWIEANYPAGVDAAERVRLFIRDAYANLGTLWVLSAATPRSFPVRYNWSPSGTFIERLLLRVFSWMGTWDADGRAYGEVEDNADCGRTSPTGYRLDAGGGARLHRQDHACDRRGRERLPDIFASHGRAFLPDCTARSSPSDRSPPARFSMTSVS